MGLAAGIPLELLHRVTAIATGGLDALPHDGAVITLLSICALKHLKVLRRHLDVDVPAPRVAPAVWVMLGSLIGSL